MQQEVFDLHQYTDPSCLAKLSLKQLEELCQSIRETIISVTQKNGGHLGANLGVVELTVALLRTWDCLRSPVVFDVGHQSYAYKLLTGRKEQFETLRLQGGLSGFPKREESPYDAFNTGHSSTSISAALGLARAARAQGKTESVVALIGDGAMTGGLAWEALNNIGPEDQILLILNDNGMSIAPNVGRLHNHLEQIRIHPKYLKAKPWVQNVLSRIPVLGQVLVRILRGMKNRTRHALQAPKDTLFETLGFRYYGPVEGHDLAGLIRHLEALREIRGPRVLHVHTQKGHGYAPAEQDPAEYHGVSPNYQARLAVDSQQLESGHSTPVLGSFTEAFSQFLLEQAEQRQDIHAITAAMPSGTGLDRFAARYPKRFSDVGIAEAHALCFAAGMAAGGMKPVVALYSTFLQRAYDQLIHDCCLQNLPVTVVLDRAGLVGADGETHQGCYDLAALLPLPNLYLQAPATYAELQLGLQLAVESNEGPWVIRYPKGAEEKEGASDPVPEVREGCLQPVILHEGTSANLVVVGPLRGLAREACARLRKRGISIQLVAPGHLKPLNPQVLARCLCPNRPLLIIEEGSEIGSWGNYLIRTLNWGAPSRSLGLPDRPIEQATVQQSRISCGLTADVVVETLYRLLEE